MKEDDVITLIRDTFSSVSEDVKLSVGDDGSVVEVEEGMELVTVLDTITVGTHYLPETSSDSIGHKAIAVNLSDMAAMGAKPKWAHLSLSIPEAEKVWIEKFIEGAKALASKHGLVIIGGDTIKGPEMVALSVQGLVRKDRYVTRKNANIGDLIYVTGYLGSAAFGLHLLKSGLNEPKQCIKDFNLPVPRVSEGFFLSDYASSMIDISDGLQTDLSKLAKASNVGFSLNIDQLPIRREMLEIDSEDAISMALFGGDDYELCFTIPKEKRDEFEQKWHVRFNTKLSHVGMVTKSLEQYKYNGQDYMIENRNFEHF